MKHPFFAVVETKPRPPKAPPPAVKPEPPPKLESLYPPESKRWGTT